MPLARALKHPPREIHSDTNAWLERRQQVAIPAPDLQDAQPAWDEELEHAGKPAMVVRPPASPDRQLLGDLVPVCLMRVLIGGEGGLEMSSRKGGCG